MKVSIMISVSIVFFILFTYTQQSWAKQPQPIEVIAEKMLKEGIEIDEWSLYARQGFDGISDVGSFFRKGEELKSSLPQATWVSIHEEAKQKLIGTMSVDGMNVRIVFSYVSEQKMAFLSIQGVGKGWNEKKSSHQQKVIQQIGVDIFQQTPTFFACVKGTSNAIINGTMDKYVENFLEDFSAKEIESMEEESFISVSAYTEQWKNVLLTHNLKMNLQMAIRNTEDKKSSVVIGTPIITLEY